MLPALSKFKIGSELKTLSLLLQGHITPPHILQIHARIFRFDADQNDLIATRLIGHYPPEFSLRVFNHLTNPNIFPSNAIIRVLSEQVLTLFIRMIQGNLMPEDDTMVSILSACPGLEIRELEKWQNILSDFDGSNENVNGFLLDSADTVLIYLYGKQGEIEMSRELFDRIAERGGTKRSVLPWNTMINCYAQNCLPLEALSLFRLMITGSNPTPNHVTMVSVLSSCAQVGDLDLGRWVHNYMKTRRHNKGLLESNTFLATAFIDMYSKCGNLERAKEVFDTMVSKDVVAFNAMIMSLAINGKGEEALNLFSKMIENSVNPNGGTFLGILSACNHSGLVSEGRRIFKNMTLDYSIVPELEHYACYTDLLARVGYIEEALEVVNAMPVEPNGLLWGALLGGCLANSRVDLALDIARRLVKVDPNNSGGYVMLSNVYASGHRWSELSELRGLMKERGVRKQPGCSWISVDGVVHEFIVGSTSHPHIQKTYHILDRLSKGMRCSINLLGIQEEFPNVT